MKSIRKGKQMSKTKTYKGTREDWLEEWVKLTFKKLKDEGFKDFVKKENEIQISFGHMPKGTKRTVVGVCQMLSEDSDIKKLDEKGTRQIFIKPTYSAKTQADNLEIISTVIHEVLHAVLPASVGHSRKFEKVGKDFLKLAGKPTNMGRHNEDGKANPDFDKWVKPLLKKIGNVPHIALKEHTKAPKTGIKIACINAEECTASTDRSREQGYGYIWRSSTASIKQQKTSLKKVAEIINGEIGIFSCPACQSNTEIIAEGNFR